MNHQWPNVQLPLQKNLGIIAERMIDSLPIAEGLIVTTVPVTAVLFQLAGLNLHTYSNSQSLQGNALSFERHIPGLS